MAIAVVVGLLWASCHLPLFLLYDLAASDPSRLPSCYLRTAALAIVLAWLDNSTAGALLVVMIAHAAGNLHPFFTISGEPPTLVATAPLTELAYVVALAVAGYAGSRTLSRDGTLPPVPGREADHGDPV